MNSLNRGKELQVVTAILVAAIVCCAAWGIWGYPAWKVHQAKASVAERVSYPDPVFRKITVGPSPLRTVCGEVSVGGQAFRRFMAGDGYALIDPSVGGDSDQAFWTEYWRTCIDVDKYLDSLTPK